jgi:predicted hotdog family 3-hydroxylacyl-ACP dehydratase
MNLPVPAERLIPHRPPMQLIEALEEFDGDSGAISAVVEAGNPLLEEDGALADVALLELLAQSFAALQGYADSFSGQQPRQGFLVGVRKVSFFARPHLGDRLRIHVQATARLEGFAVVEGKVMRGDEMLAEGNLKLWIVPPTGSEEK